jgi:hypothetical protein
LYYIIISFSIIIIPFTRATAYYPQYAILYLSPLLVFTKKIIRKDVPLILLGLVLLSSRLTNPESFRFSTIAYGLLNICLFSYYMKLLPQSGVPIVSFQKLMKYLLYAFAIVLLIQIISRLIGLPLLNKSYNMESGFKFNSLAFEASQIGPVITILVYGFIKTEEINIGRRINLKEFCKREKWLIIAYMFTSIFSNSVTCLLSSVVLLAYFVDKRKIINISLFVAGAVLIAYLMGTEATDRIFAIISPILKGDTEELYYIDASASARINPYIYYFQEFDVMSINTWLGYGCDYGSTHTWELLTGGSDSQSLMAGGISGFMYDYGLIAFIAYLIFIFSICRFRSYETFIFMTLFIFNGINFYSNWLFFMIIYSISYYQRCQYKYQLS